MFDVLMEGVKVMQARMLGEEGQASAGIERECDVCNSVGVCLMVEEQGYCCLTCKAREMVVCSMCGEQFNMQLGKVSVNGDYFCQPCVGQLAKEAVYAQS